MKRTLFIICLSLFSRVAVCQVDESKKSTDDLFQGNFTLKLKIAKTDPATESETRMVAKDIWFRYKADGGKQEGFVAFEDIGKGKLESVEDKIVLSYPLNYSYFELRLNALVAKTNSDATIESSSVLDVFYWISTKTQIQSPRIVAAKLTCGTWVKVLTDQKTELSYEKREEAENKTIGEIHAKEAKLHNLGEEKIQIVKLLRKRDDSADSVLKEYDVKLSEIPNKEISDQLNDSTLRISSKEINQFNPSPRKAKGNQTQNASKENDAKKPLEDKKAAKLKAAGFLIINRTNLNNLLKDYDKTRQELEKLKPEAYKKYYGSVEYCKLQFEKGFLEKIIVLVRYGTFTTPQIFENMYPIGFSSTHNFKSLNNIVLYSRNTGNGTESPHFIVLADAIKLYENQPDLATKDYSPGDTVVTVNPSKQPFTVLYKPRSIYLLDTKAFTDINGLNEESPNGIVQLEASRRFNLWTYRYQDDTRGMNHGWLSYLNVQLTWSKIEQKKKELPLINRKSFDNGVLITPSYATTLDFIRYENASIRAELNALLWDIPTGKVTFYLDGGFKAGFTPVLDSVHVLRDGAVETNQTPLRRNAYHFTYYPKIWVEFFAEKRYGFSVGYQPNYTQVYTNNFYKQVLSYSGKGGDLDAFALNRSSRWWHSLEFKGRLDTNPANDNGKIFFLARFNWQNKDVNSFYPQVQIGYAFQIVK